MTVYAHSKKGRPVDEWHKLGDMVLFLRWVEFLRSQIVLDRINTSIAAAEDLQ